MYPDQSFLRYRYRRWIVRNDLAFGNVSSRQIDCSHLGSLSGNEKGLTGETHRNRTLAAQVTRARDQVRK